MADAIRKLINALRRRRFRGMIRPDMALAIEDSRAVADRKSIWMVGYLRARRLHTSPAVTGLYRRKRFEDCAIVRAMEAEGRG